MSKYNPYNSLIHYGVPGQKPGKRRYQNEDGSLTPDGREHYGVGDPRQPGQGTPVSKFRPNPPTTTAQKVARMKANQYKMARNRGESRLGAWFSANTPLGLIRSARRAKQKREETIARKRAAREAARG